MPVAGTVNPMTQFCFAMGIKGSARHILGKNSGPGAMEKGGGY